MSETQATLVYDGDCRICLYWVNYWQLMTGKSICYRTYQDAATDFPSIPLDDFKRSIQLIESGGRISSSAAATYRVLSYAPGHGAWSWLYDHAPGVAPASECAYTFFSRRRGLLSRISHTLWGPRREPSNYALVDWIFLRGLGVIYAAAFASLGVQILGLVGAEGILPLGEYLAAAHQGLGASAYWNLPTLFWLNSSDTLLIAGTLLGVALGALVATALWVRPALVVLFVLYLSFVYAGQIFLSFQWDLLLLEVGFLAIFLTSGSKIVVWLYRWLLFRFLFLSGVVKLLSSDPTWSNLTALNYHFWTQPLPTPLAWYAAELPQWALRSATAATLVIELGLVFLVFLPRRPRAALAWAVLLFQLLIVLTGNYSFFNLLTMLLCVFLFDDAALSQVLPSRLVSYVQEHAPRPSRSTILIATLLALIVVPVGLNRLWQPFMHSNLPVAGVLTDAISPLLIVNAYGPFATTTTTRPEIIIEGSNDGERWRPYVFRYKPGPVDRRPVWNIPHQPRLDWQMWFAAYKSAAQNPWLERLLLGLLKGSPPVLSLLASNPFPDHPPKYVRAIHYDYRFVDAAMTGQTGQWWARRPSGLYFPPVSLASFLQG